MVSVGTYRVAVLAWAIALAVQCPVPASAQALIGELESLIENHPQIQAKSKTLAASGAAVSEARAAYMPTVKVTGDTGPEYVDSPSRRNTEGHRYYKGRETSGLTITQKIFDGFATDSAVDAAALNQSMSNADLRITRQSTLLEGSLAYIDVIRQSKLISLARENERKLKEQQNLEDERVQKGAGVAADVLAAKQRLATAKNRRLEFEQAFHAAVAKYEQVFGHPPEVGALIDPPLAVDLLPATLEEALKIAEDENPTVELATRTEMMTGEKRRGAGAGYFPTLDLIGKANYENDKNATVGVRRDWSLLLTANWELFSGFKTDSQVSKATFDHAASLDLLRHAGRKVQESVRTTWYKLASARQRMEVLANAATLAEEVWEGKKKSRQAGKATVQEVLDEETRINDARIDYNRAYYDMIQASYEMLTHLGRTEVENLAAAPGKFIDAPLPQIPPSFPIPLPDPAGAEPPPPLPAPPPAIERQGRNEPPVTLAAPEPATPPPPAMASGPAVPEIPAAPPAAPLPGMVAAALTPDALPASAIAKPPIVQTPIAPPVVAALPSRPDAPLSIPGTFAPGSPEAMQERVRDLMLESQVSR